MTEILTALALLAALPLLGAFWLWMFLDCLRYERTGSDEKIYWLAAILLLGPVGALVYYYGRRRERLSRRGR